MASQVQEPGPGPGKRPRVQPLLWILIAVGLLGLAWMTFQTLLTAHVVEVYRGKNERIGLFHLTSIAEAQERVRAGTGAYWREDVAGLADLPLITAPLADADDRPVRAGLRKPLRGYLFRSLPYSDEAHPDLNRFAVLYFPVRPAGYMYVLTENGSTWRKEAVAGGVDVFPADPAAEGWERTP